MGIPVQELQQRITSTEFNCYFQTLYARKHGRWYEPPREMTLDEEKAMWFAFTRMHEYE